MRLLRLDLERFRHFREQTLPLAEGRGASAAPGGRAFSVVYGPNEAGKTTVLEAVRCFLFGFRDKSPELTVDFEQSELRVGGLLELDNGKQLVATRTKGRKQTLFGKAIQGGEEFDDEWLSARLSRPSRAVFENVFAFSLEMLARGAESLKEHEVRTAIYGAGFGGKVDLARVLADFGREREALFKEGGKVPRVNQIARAIDERRRAVRLATTPSEEYRRAKEELARKREAAEGKYAAEAELRLEVERLRSVTLALEPFHAMRAARDELAAILRPPGFSAESSRAYERWAVTRERARDELTSLEAKIAESAARLAELQAGAGAGGDALEAAGGAVDRLMEGLGAYKKARAEVPALEDELASLERRTTERLASLMPAWGAEALVRADLDAPMRAEFGDALEEQERLRVERERLAARASEIAALAVQHEARRRRLCPPLPDEGIDPARLRVPAAEEVARFEALSATQERAEATFTSRLEALATRLRANEEERAAILSGGHAPTEDELRSARGRRDAGLRIVEQALLLGTSSVDAEVKRYGEGESLPRAYERAVRAADEVVDRMRLRADAVQRRALLEAEHARLSSDRDGVEAERRALAEARAEAERAYAALFDGAGFTPLGPAAMRKWLDDRLAFLEIDQRLGEERARVGALEAEHARAERAWGARWTALLSALGLSPDTAPARARRAVEELAQLRAEFVGRRRDLEASLAKARALAASYEEDVRAVLARCGLELSDAARDVETVFARLKAAREAARTREELARARSGDEQRAATVRARLDESERALSELRALAGAEDDEGVRRVAQRCLRADELERAVAEHDQSLRRAGARWGYDAWIADVEGARLDVLERRIAQAGADADALRQEARAIDQEVGGFAEGLARTGEGSLAAEEQAAMEGLRASLAEEVERYAEVSFAESILRASIRRFEREHQSELIASASRLFRAMTNERYERIERRLDGSLFAVRAGGRALSPDALSTGTREQLFVALRLAYVEHYQKSAESLPVVLDDVFVNFDEERTRGALAALALFSTSTQVLFFTCHRSLVELVREVVPDAHFSHVPA